MNEPSETYWPATVESTDRLPKNFKHLTVFSKNRLRAELMLTLSKERLKGERTRPFVIIGVTQPTPFMNGSPTGTLQQGKGYRVSWDEYTKLMLDEDRGPYVCRLCRLHLNPVELACRAAASPA
jgi:hypothetical protein